MVEVEDETRTIGTTETAEEIGENINKDTMITGDKGKITRPVVAGSSGIIRTIGTEEPKGKVAVEERSGTEVKVKVMGTEAGVIDGTHTNNTLPQDITQAHTIKIRTTTAPRLWGIKPSIQRSGPQYPPYPQQYPGAYPCARSQQASNVCQLCQSPGHYDYQCQFASDILTRTQKAFGKA